jgi:hypothetical protein
MGNKVRVCQNGHGIDLSQILEPLLGLKLSHDI